MKTVWVFTWIILNTVVRTYGGIAVNWFCVLSFGPATCWRYWNGVVGYYLQKITIFTTCSLVISDDQRFLPFSISSDCILFNISIKLLDCLQMRYGIFHWPFHLLLKSLSKLYSLFYLRVNRWSIHGLGLRNSLRCKFMGQENDIEMA